MTSGALYKQIDGLLRKNHNGSMKIKTRIPSDVTDDTLKKLKRRMSSTHYGSKGKFAIECTNGQVFVSTQFSLCLNSKKCAHSFVRGFTRILTEVGVIKNPIFCVAHIPEQETVH